MSSLPALTLSATLLAGLTFCLTALPHDPPVLQGADVGQKRALINPAIDYPKFLEDAGKVFEIRQNHRVTQEEFSRMAQEPGTVVLDARSADKFALLHVRGALNLPLTDFTEGTLASAIPGKVTRVLIYCNNNFENQEQAFARKRVATSLNIYTFNSLYSYGYTNVYELGELLDIRATKLSFDGMLSVDGKAPASEGSRP